MSDNGRVRGHFTSFTGVPTDVAKANMSARAKGIYLDICYLLDLERDFPDNPNNKVTKTKVARLSTEGKAAFDTGWNELKEMGFLVVTKTHTSKHLTYSYDVYATPYQSKENSEEKAKSSNLSDIEIPHKVEEQNTIDFKIPTYDDVSNYINKRICYTSWQNKTLADVIEPMNDRFEPENSDIYVRDIVEDIRNIIVSVLVKTSKYIYIGKDKHNIEEIKSVLNKITNLHISHIINSLYTIGFFAGEVEITNIQAYLLKTIYNSILTYNVTHMMNKVIEEKFVY